MTDLLAALQRSFEIRRRVPIKVYIAGPMTGLPDYNLPAFAAAKELLDSRGYDAVNPGSRGVIEGYEWNDYMRDGLKLLLECDQVAVLPGWEASRGANLEIAVADALAMPWSPIDEY